MQPADPAVTALAVGDEDHADLDNRCAAHPGRPAADSCPVCARPRCAADAATRERGCSICGGRATSATQRPLLDLQAVSGAAALCHVAAVVAAHVGQQYVEVQYFSLLVPAGVGIVSAIAAERGAGRARGTALRVIAALYAVLSTALAFRLEGSVGLTSPIRTVLPPYLAAAAGAWFWTQPPKKRRRRGAAPPD